MSSDIPLIRISVLAPPFSGDVKGLVPEQDCPRSRRGSMHLVQGAPQGQPVHRQLRWRQGALGPSRRARGEVPLVLAQFRVALITDQVPHLLLAQFRAALTDQISHLRLAQFRAAITNQDTTWLAQFRVALITDQVPHLRLAQFRAALTDQFPTCV